MHVPKFKILTFALPNSSIVKQIWKIPCDLSTFSYAYKYIFIPNIDRLRLGFLWKCDLKLSFPASTSQKSEWKKYFQKNLKNPKLHCDHRELTPRVNIMLFGQIDLSWMFCISPAYLKNQLIIMENDICSSFTNVFYKWLKNKAVLWKTFKIE